MLQNITVGRVLISSVRVVGDNSHGGGPMAPSAPGDWLKDEIFVTP